MNKPFWSQRIPTARFVEKIHDLRDKVTLGCDLIPTTGFPFGRASRGATPVIRRRRQYARRQIRKRWPILVRPFALLAMCVAWPFGCVVEIRQILNDFPEVSADRARNRVFLTVLFSCLRYNKSPREVIQYHLHCARDPCPDAWIADHEISVLLAVFSDGRARSFANNKVIFARFCKSIDLPHIPTVAHWRAGMEIYCDVTGWGRTVVTKPVAANNARGLEVWSLKDGFYRNGDLVLRPAELGAHCRSLSLLWGEVLLQQYLQLHDTLVERGLSGMPTVRLTTGRMPQGDVVVLDAYFSAPLPGRIASNDGIGPYWSVDLETGCLSATDTLFLPKWTGQQAIDGLQLPDWQHAVAAVLKGHSRFPGTVAILGWDVAFTENGPILIEVNTGISFGFEQAIRGKPAGNSQIGAVLDAWILET